MSSVSSVLRGMDGVDDEVDDEFGPLGLTKRRRMGWGGISTALEVVVDVVLVIICFIKRRRVKSVR